MNEFSRRAIIPSAQAPNIMKNLLGHHDFHGLGAFSVVQHDQSLFVKKPFSSTPEGGNRCTGKRALVMSAKTLRTRGRNAQRLAGGVSPANRGVTCATHRSWFSLSLRLGSLPPTPRTPRSPLLFSQRRSQHDARRLAAPSHQPPQLR